MILTDPTYTGMVVYKGQVYSGRHDRLVSPELFDRVQQVRAQRCQGTRDRERDHYLKGKLWCGRCQRRLIMDAARSRSGDKYFYFRCAGMLRHECDLPGYPVAVLEATVIAHYNTVAVTDAESDQVRALLAETVHAQETTRGRWKS